MQRLLAFVISSFLVVFPAFADSTVHGLATSATSPVPAGSCVYIDQGPGTDTKACFVYPGLIGAGGYPVGKAANYTLNADNGGTSDTAALLYATANGVTFTAPNPAAGSKGLSYNFGNDGSHGYTLATVGATATFYGSTHCTGGTTAVIPANNQVIISDDGTDYQCLETGGAQLNLAQAWTAGQAVTPTTGGAQSAAGTYTPDFSTSNSVTLTFGAGNLTIANPTNVKAGQSYIIALTQDGTGSRLVTWGANFKWAGGTAPTLSTAASAKDVISCFADTTTTINCTLAVKGAA